MVLLLQVLVCFLLHSVISDCPPHLNSTTVAIRAEGQQTALQDALLSLETPASGNCTQIQLGSGIYYLTQRVHTLQNVVIQRDPDSYNDSKPVIRCAGGMRRAEEVDDDDDDEQLLATVSFSNVSYAEISGIIFEYCPLPLHFKGVEHLRIEKSTFRHFDDTAVSTYNCDTVEVVGSKFLNNTASGALADLPFRINAGGIAFSSHNPPSVIASLRVTDCVFTNNSALQTAVNRTTTQNTALKRYSGRGGGLGAALGTIEHLHISVENCTFAGNTAKVFGGGLYIITISNATHHHYSVINCTFLENAASSAGGGVGLSLLFGKRLDTMNQVQLKNSTFVRNRAGNFGGGAYILSGGSGGVGNHTLVEDCKFLANEAPEHGSAVAMVPLTTYFDYRQLGIIVFKNNLFQRNIGTQLGTLSTYQLPLSLEGNNTFIGNIGCGLRVTLALADVYGSLSFINNTMLDSGALSMASFGQLRLHRGAALLFEGNVGSIASAIDVEPLSTLPFALVHTLCFLQYEDPRLNQHQWNVSVMFVGNTALVGSAIFAKDLQSCVIHGGNLGSVFRSSQFQYINNTNSALLDPHNPKFDVSTPQVDFNVSASSAVYTYPLSVFPGETFSVTITSTNELGDPAEGVYRIEEASESLNKPLILHPSTIHNFPNVHATEFHIEVTHKSYVVGSNHTLLFAAQGEASFGRNFPDMMSQSIVVSLEGCPPGRSLGAIHGEGVFECDCDRDNENILSCEPNGYDVVLKDGKWGVSSLGQSKGKPNELHAYKCPQGYCRCTMGTVSNSNRCSSLFQTKNSSTQCACHRTGYLCGSCSNGTGVTALLDRCERCSPLHGLLIAALVIADTIVILGVMVVSLWKRFHLPSWLSSVIFYIQVVPFATRHLARPFWHLHAPMFYLGSLLGLYFPYDFCLYPNATAEEVYAIKYIPLILASVICPSVIVAANCRGIKVNYSGVWLIVMLLFNQVVYTSASVLNCPRLRDESGTVSSVWFVDGSVTCFTGGHIPLALWAILCLLLCVVAIFAPMIYYACRKEAPVNVLWLWKTVTRAYQKKYEWWYCLELARRFIVVTVIVAFPGKVVPPLCLLAVYFAIYCYVCPYCSALANTLEVVLLGSFIVLLHIPFLPLSSSYHVMTTDTCGHPVLSASVVTSLMAALYYCTLALSMVAMVMAVCMKKFRQAIKCKSEGKFSFKVLMSSKQKPEQVPSQAHQDHSTATLVHYTTVDVDLRPTETVDDNI